MYEIMSLLAAWIFEAWNIHTRDISTSHVLRNVLLLPIGEITHVYYVKVTILSENFVGKVCTASTDIYYVTWPRREESDIVDAAEKSLFMKYCWIDGAVSMYLAHDPRQFTQVSCASMGNE